MMTRSLLAALLLMSPGAWAQPAIAPPQLGFVQDSAHALRPVYGLAGNFILGPSVRGNIVNQAFSGSIGLLKTDSSLAAFDSQGKRLASREVAPGPALFAFSAGGNMALAYIVSDHSFIEWRGSEFAPVSVDAGEAIAGSVLAIALPNGYEGSLMVQRNDTIWELNFPVGKWGGVSRMALAGVQAPLLALASGDLVYRDASGIAVRRRDGPEVHIAATLPPSFSLQQMNQDWVQVSDLNSRARFAVRTAPGREGFYRLPE